MDTGAVAPSTARRVGARRRPNRLNGVLTGTAWLPEGHLELHEWVDQGRRLGVVGRAVGWWIGDWLRYGTMKFGERYARAARITGYDVQTLMNMAYVASAYDVSQRHETLSWSHHSEVAALDPEERERWLDLAERNRLSVRCLREEVRRARRRHELEQGEGEPAGELEAASDDPEVRCPQCGCKIGAESVGPLLREGVS
jgi:hypothetical protein